MPNFKEDNYRRPKWLFNSHLETIYPALFRKVKIRAPKHERIPTEDNDFLDLDWYRNDSDHLIIISHGLEGSSDRPYMLGMTKAFINKGYDVLTWNYRGCGPELNKQMIFYHSGATYDLDRIVEHASKDYDKISLIGFSLGGNLTLKYLGEDRTRPDKIESGVAISVPLHLAGASKRISERENFLYSRRFLKSLKKKVRDKAVHFPDEIPLEKLNQLNRLSDFDDVFTGPFHGFTDAAEYYEVNSALFFLEGIQTRTLILNAKNDPFLSQECFPYTLAESLEKVTLEAPSQGGHVGFSTSNDAGMYYSEKRAVEFVQGED